MSDITIPAMNNTPTMTITRNHFLSPHTVRNGVIINAVFNIQGKDGKPSHKKLLLAKSTIPKAGRGIYTLEKIPKGYYALYTGIYYPKEISSKADFEYSWEVYVPDDDGDPSDKVAGYVDGKNDMGNWTRFVNCGTRARYNNFEEIQHNDRVYYRSMRIIFPGEELFCDYGEEYRRDNLSLKGKY